MLVEVHTFILQSRVYNHTIDCVYRIYRITLLFFGFSMPLKISNAGLMFAFSLFGVQKVQICNNKLQKNRTMSKIQERGRFGLTVGQTRVCVRVCNLGAWRFEAHRQVTLLLLPAEPCQDKDAAVLTVIHRHSQQPFYQCTDVCVSGQVRSNQSGVVLLSGSPHPTSLK